MPHQSLSYFDQRCPDCPLNDPRENGPPALFRIVFFKLSEVPFVMRNSSWDQIAGSINTKGN